MGYTITPYNENDQPINLIVTSKLHKAKKIGENTEAAKVEIHQIRGNWSRIGKYLLGIRRDNGYYDWQMVPNDCSKPYD